MLWWLLLLGGGGAAVAVAAGGKKKGGIDAPDLDLKAGAIQAVIADPDWQGVPEPPMPAAQATQMHGGSAGILATTDVAPGVGKLMSIEAASLGDNSTTFYVKVCVASEPTVLNTGACTLHKGYQFRIEGNHEEYSADKLNYGDGCGPKMRAPIDGYWDGITCNGLYGGSDAPEIFFVKAGRKLYARVVMETAYPSRCRLWIHVRNKSF